VEWEDFLLLMRDKGYDGDRGKMDAIVAEELKVTASRLHPCWLQKRFSLHYFQQIRSPCTDVVPEALIPATSGTHGWLSS